jgi:hypothetical protein
MSLNEAPGARKKEEIFQGSQTLDRVLADKRKRYLFSRLLNTDPKDQELVRGIYEKYQKQKNEKNEKKEQYTDEQRTFLNDRLAEFRQRMVLAEEARMIFSPKEIARTAKGHEPLREIMSLNTKSPELLQEYLSIMAMENPASLRQILDVKRQINEKRRSASYQWHDAQIQNILNRFNLSREDFDAMHNITDEDARRAHFRQLAAEKAGRLKKAIDFGLGFVKKSHESAAVDQAYDQLNDLERNALAQQIEDSQREIAEVIVPLLKGDDEVMHTIEFVRFREDDDNEGGVGNERKWGGAAKDILRALATETGTFASQEVRWAGGIADAILKASTGLSFESGPHKGGGGEKREKKESKEKEKEAPHEVEHFDKPSELYEAFFKQIKDKKDKEAQILLKENLTNDPKSDEESKDIYSQVEKIMRKKKDGWQDKVKLILRVYLLGETEEEAEKVIEAGN